MSDDSVIVFAYGSNMLSTRIRGRCPSARALGIAWLAGHKLRWHKSSKDGSGKCDIVPSSDQDSFVLGVLYEISGNEKPDLDRAEGRGNGYVEIDVEVLLDGVSVQSKAYQATAIDTELAPYTWYRALVVAGAQEHKLPADYISSLATVQASEDSNRGRHEKNMRLIERTHP